MELKEGRNNSFGIAIEAIKAGYNARREGWNGKEQYIALVTVINCSIGDAIFCPYHEDAGSRAIAFFGTRGTQIGWLASQSDMLAEDWEIFI